MSVYLKHSIYSRDVTRREFLVLAPLVFLTVLLGVYPNLVLEPMHASVIKSLLI